MYYVIDSDDDGTTIREVTEDGLQEVLADYEGTVQYLDRLPLTLDHWSQPNYWGEGKVLIIRGEIVTPKIGESDD